MNYKKSFQKFSLVSEPTHFDRVQITSSFDCYDAFVKLFENLDIYESFYIIFLNRANITTGYALLSQGGICGTVVDIKILAKYAIDSLCSSIIIAHNHPSGNLTPSAEDHKMTKKIKEAMSLFDIRLIDHIILSPTNNYYSFADEGLL